MAEITVEGRRHLVIRCGCCSTPILAQEPGNTETNDAYEVCARCTRVMARSYFRQRS